MDPLEMPPYIRSFEFDTDYIQQLSPTGEQGFVQTINRSAPVWRAKFVTGGLNEQRWQEMTYFKDMLEGSIGTFLGYDAKRPMPYAYRGASLAADPWTQTGQVAPRITAQDYAASTITLDRLQNGAIITIGDYISVKVGLLWFLFRSMQTVAGVAGNTATIVVKPRPQIPSLVATNIRYRQACCEMKVIGRFDTGESLEELPSWTFNAAQYMARAPT